jgi:hypothetical protein
MSKPKLTRRSSTSIDNNPDLHFLIVINPNSGPGEPPAPDANYSRELPLFNAKENVTTVGYVRMQYCRRHLPRRGAERVVARRRQVSQRRQREDQEHARHSGRETCESSSCIPLFDVSPRSKQTILTIIYQDHPQPRHSPRQRTNASPPRSHRRLRGELLALPLVRAGRAARPCRLRPERSLVHLALCASQPGHTAGARAAASSRVHLRHRPADKVLRGFRRELE